MQLGTLYHKGKEGALFQWAVWTEGNKICTAYGQVGGAMQTATKLAEPKNRGRANATSADQQAELEAKAMWDKKLRIKYSLTPEETEEANLLPMLAHKYEDHKNKVTFPCDVQPKLNGVRCLAEKKGGKVTLYSRTGKVYNVAHISGALERFLPDNTVADGEIYIHGETLQRINSLVKRPQPDSVELQYHVYDMPRWKGVEGERWQERKLNLAALYSSHNETIVRVKTSVVKSEHQIFECQAEFVQEGYEGAIVRTLGGVYLWVYRSHDLLKVKTFQDDEFAVTGVHVGVGKAADCPTWECVTKDGVSFSTTAMGTKAARKEMLKNAKKYIGRMLTVRFFEYTPDGCPFHGVGVAFRLDEDLPA